MDVELLFESLPQYQLLIVHNDQATRILKSNRHFLAISGFDSGDLQDRDISLVIPSFRKLNDWIKVQRDSRLPHFQGPEVSVVFGARSASMNIQFCFLRRESDGDIYQIFLIPVVTTFLDVRDQVTEASELRRFMDTANAPIFGVDSECHVNEWNQKCEQITGYPKLEIVGKNLIDSLILEFERENVSELIRNALHGVETSVHPIRFLAKDNSEVEMLVSATTRRSKGGDVVGVLCVGQDITGLRQKEVAIQQAQRIESLGLLTGGVAHDFNNLMTVISGNLALVLEDPSISPDGIEILEDAVSAARDGTELTRQLLSYARKQPLEPQSVSSREMLSQVARLLTRTISPAITIELQDCSEELFCLVDNAQLESALINVCLNSRDSIANEGLIRLAVSRKTLFGEEAESLQISPGKYVLISVEDSGCGIEAETIDRVFEPFFTTKETGKGTGMGLSMVEGFCRQSDGTVLIESEPGVGTKVSLMLPEIASSTVEVALKRSVPQKEESTVLVVEDDERVRKFAERCLMGAGFFVISASSAHEAQRVLLNHSEKIGCVFSDVVMPGGQNGRELATEVSKSYPEIRVILTTGFEDKEDNEDTRFPLLRKPYTRYQLVNFVNDIFSADPPEITGMKTHDDFSKILFIDDNEDFRRTYCQLIEDLGFPNVIELESAEEGLSYVLERGADLIVSDLYLPGMNGDELYQTLLESGHQLPFIVITGSNIEREGINVPADVRVLRKPFGVQSFLDAIDEVEVGFEAR